jgi:hypothetical protein
MSELCLVLGPAGSGRRAVAEELARFGWPEGVPVTVLGDGEAGWSMEEGAARLPAPTAGPALLVTDGRRSQVDQVEALIAAAPAAGWSIRRIVAVLDLPLLHRHPELEPWYRSCLHFADAAVLTRRWEVPNAWLSELERGLEVDFRTCLRVFLPRTGGLARPVELVAGEPRRASLALDDLDAVDEMEFDEDNLPDEPFDLVRKADPYFARDASGRREILVPDIGPALAAENR